MDLLYFFLELAVLEDNKQLKDTLAEFQMPTMQYGTLKIAGFGKTHKKCCENDHTLNLLLFVPRSLVPNDVAAKLQEVEKIPPAGGRVSSSPRLTLRWCCCAATSCAVSCAGTGAPAASGSATGSS